MAEKRYLYLMVSRTDTNIGRIIRVFSRYPYNHVSLSIDPTLRERSASAASGGILPCMPASFGKPRSVTSPTTRKPPSACSGWPSRP